MMCQGSVRRTIETRVFTTSLGMLVALCLMASAVAADDETLFCEGQEYVENVYLTTGYGAAPADVILGKRNMLECNLGEYALCYYSGSDPMPCEVGEDGYALCKCQIFEASDGNPMYVDINAILNTCVYIETTTECGKYGEGTPGGYCPNLGGPIGGAVAVVEPPVCRYIARKSFAPEADFISTFSFQAVTAPDGTAMQIGCTDCESATYAGCMTASCFGEETVDGRRYTTCRCPTFDGPYQYGRRGAPDCDLGSGSNQVWSAAYNPDGCGQSPLTRD